MTADAAPWASIRHFMSFRTLSASTFAGTMKRQCQKEEPGRKSITSCLPCNLPLLNELLQFGGDGWRVGEVLVVDRYLTTQYHMTIGHHLSTNSRCIPSLC